MMHNLCVTGRYMGMATIVMVLGSLLGTACGDVCGDGVCDESECRESCPDDCVFCGSGFCDDNDNVHTCAADCDPCSTPAASIGERCMAHDECGQGGACLRLEGDAHPVCYQVCVPGGCPGGNMCESGDLCAGITDKEPFSEGRPFGVCFTPEPGDQAAYASCSGPSDCEAGAACVMVNDDHGAFCSPYCGDGSACPEGPEGMNAACVLQSADATAADHCALGPCTDDGSCPDGMVCLPMNIGGMCLWP